MASPVQPLRLEEVDWSSLLPWVRLFHGFRMAIHPPKMLLALLLVVLLYCGGKLMDSVWGPRVDTSPFPTAVDDSSLWSGSIRSTPIGGGAPVSLAAPVKQGIFATALADEVRAFERMINAASALKFGGFDELTLSGANHSATVVGSLREMILVIPGWLYRTHPWFSLIYCVYGMMIWALLAGAIARMAALQATRNQHISSSAALSYAGSRWLRLFLTPLLPLALIAVVGLVLSFGGLLFFNSRLTEMVGGVFFIVALLGSLIIALLSIGLLAGANMIYPAICVDGADALDALSRIYHYALFRPWRWLFYNLVALVYGAITYLFVGTVIFFALQISHWWVELGVVRHGKDGISRFDAIWPPPQFGHLAYRVDMTTMDWSSRAAAALVWVWVFLFIGLLAAYAINYYLCSNTWIYLLLRRASDQTGFDEVYQPPGDAEGGEPIASQAPTADEPDGTSAESSRKELER